MSKKKEDHPFVELDFYRERVVARVHEISFSYRLVGFLIAIVLGVLAELKFDQIITLITTMAQVLQ